MTCIVGYTQGKKVWMGADSHGFNGWAAMNRLDPKVFKREHYIIGFTTSYRMGQLLMVCDLPEPVADPDGAFAFMVREFIPAIRDALVSGGMAHVEHNVERGGEFLIGFNGLLFQIDNDFQVAQPADDYAACGCGESYALGALRMMEIMDYEALPYYRVKDALNLAEYFSGGVRGPFKILDL